MPSIDEAGRTGQTPFAAAAQAGVETISLNQEMTFDLYDRVVLPLDGYVFWVKRLPTNKVHTQFTVKGSLHVTSISNQDEGANITNNAVIFTAEQEINDLNDASPEVMWISNHPQNGYKIAFSSRTGFYEQAGLWHYRGYALYADMQTQVIDDPGTFASWYDAGTQQVGNIETNNIPTLIVSNSLPIWLLLSRYSPTIDGEPYGFANSFALYPSFLAPDNLSPVVQYGTVHIGENDTTALQAAPFIDAESSHSQLCTDTVRVTLYGGTNRDALNFVDCVNQYSLDYGTIGIMNSPVPRDSKRTQAEFNILGMKKVVTFEVSYQQRNVETIARQLIRKAMASYIPQPEPVVESASLDFSADADPQNTMLKPGLLG